MPAVPPIDEGCPQDSPSDDRINPPPAPIQHSEILPRSFTTGNRTPITPQDDDDQNQAFTRLIIAESQHTLAVFKPVIPDTLSTISPRGRQRHRLSHHTYRPTTLKDVMSKRSLTRMLRATKHWSGQKIIIGRGYEWE